MEEVLLDDMLKAPGSVRFVGPSDCGKTTLAHFTAVRILEGICDQPRVPVIVDFPQLKLPLRNFVKAVADYLRIERGRAEGLLKRFETLLLIDKAECKSRMQEQLWDLLQKEYPRARWILFQTGGAPDEIPHWKKAEGQFRDIYIGNLRRSSIRELVSRWCAFRGEDPEEAFAAVVEQMARHRLRSTGYVVLTLLLAYQAGREAEPINEATLIEHWLNRFWENCRTQARCGSPSIFEVTRLRCKSWRSFFKMRRGVASMDKAVNHLSEFLGRRASAFSASGILEFLFEVGILAREGDQVWLKLSAMEAYFGARLMQEDRAVADKVVKSADVTDYGRGLDLMASLDRRTTWLIEGLDRRLEEQEGLWSGIVELNDVTISPELRAATVDEVVSLSEDEALRPEELDYAFEAIEERVRATRTEVSEAAGGSGERGAQGSDRAWEERAGDGWEEVEKRAFYINMLGIYGTVIRNTEYADAEMKVTHVKRFFSRAGEILGSLIGAASEIQEGLLEMKYGSELEKEDGQTARREAEYAAKIIWPLVVGNQIIRSIATRKLAPISGETVNDDESLDIVRWLGLLAVIEVEAEGRAAVVKREAKRKGRGGMWAILTAHKLMNDYILKGWDIRKRDEFEGMIESVVERPRAIRPRDGADLARAHTQPRSSMITQLREIAAERRKRMGGGWGEEVL